MNGSDLTTEDTVYVTYIAAAPEQVWRALTESAFTARYFFGRSVESDWRAGSKWLLRMPDGREDIVGVVRECDPPRRLVLTWNIAWAPGQFPECVVTYDIEQAFDGVVRLTMTEAHPTPIAKGLLEGGRKGWPMILSGLKSLLETGKALNVPTPMPPKELQP